MSHERSECKPDAKRNSAQPQDAKRNSAQPQDAKRKRDSAQPQDAKRNSAQPQDAKRKRDSAQPQETKRKRDSATQENPQPSIDVDQEQGLHRRLTTWQLTMIAIGGAI